MSKEDKSIGVQAGAVRKKVSFAPQRVAVVGATGVVGREVISILEERNYPVSDLVLLASEKSAGEKVDFDGEPIAVRAATTDAFANVAVAFFAAGGVVSEKLVGPAAKAGALVIDKSSKYRLDEDVPLVVPGVNHQSLKSLSATRRLVATPNCSTTQLVQALAPLDKKFGLKRVVVSTYQAVSGAGRDGIDELDKQVRQLFNMQSVESTEVFGKRIAFNCLPAIPGRDGFLANGNNTEEQKMIDETRKILGRDDLRIGVTCVRVPVFNGHSEAVHVELSKKASVAEVREAIAAADNVVVIDAPEDNLYPTAEDAVGEDNTLVGRVREDAAFDNGFAFWVVSDNLRTGAALNAVRIAETYFQEFAQ